MANEDAAHERVVLGRRHWVELWETEQAPLDHLYLVLSWCAKALHGEQADLKARRLMRIAAANVTAAIAVRDRDDLLRPVTGKSLDLERGNTTLLLSPFRGLRNTVLTTHGVVLEVVEADGVGIDVVLVIGAFFDPGIGDCQLERSIGVGKDRDPLVSMNCSCIVQVRTDIDGVDADLGPEAADAACGLATPAPRWGLDVAAPEENRIRVIGNIPDQVLLPRLLANGVHAPSVLGTPIPALPAVWLAPLEGEAAQKVHKKGP